MVRVWSDGDLVRFGGIPRSTGRRCDGAVDFAGDVGDVDIGFAAGQCPFAALFVGAELRDRVDAVEFGGSGTSSWRPSSRATTAGATVRATAAGA